MKYDFNKMIDRRHSNSSKWNVKDNEISMSIADMDFQVAPKIIEAIKQKADFGIFGYSDVADSYFEAYQNWWSFHHDFKMEKEWMIFATGVVPAISSIVRKLTSVSENILIQSPVYNIFYNSIINNGRRILSSDLIYKDHHYEIDFEDLESKLADPQTTMMILCNPHNPIGKIWERETLAKIGELCAKHHVIVLSDEIHCDLTLSDKGYIPFASVNEVCANNSITCLSASKAFNLAGLQSACVVVKNPYLRHKVNRGLNTDEVAEPNVFAMDAVIAAFDSFDWLEECRAYLKENRRYAKEILQKQLSDVYLVDAEATYLLWIDCSQVCDDIQALCEYLRENYGLIVSNGLAYGTNGQGFIRMNIACPRDCLREGLKRFIEGVLDFQK